MVRQIVFFLLLLVIAGCTTKSVNDLNRNQSNSYARGYELTENNGIQKLTIYNPWEQAENISVSYYLIERGQPIPDSLQKEKIIFTPVERVVCLSTSHLSFLDVLGEIDCVAGISGSKYISNEKIRSKLKTGDVVDVGYDQGLNYELLLQSEPDLIMVYGIGSEVSAYVRKMEDLGLNVFLVAEYLEETPLGKAEWIKCIAPLFKKEKEAGIFFSQVESEYNSLKNKAKSFSENPGVMVGLPYRDSWWVPGGNSYLANLIADAGGNYIGKGDTSHESFVISFENALVQSSGVDIWINVGAVYSKREILASDMRFEKFPAFKNSRIYNNNGKMSPSGGNDFWESGAVYPNLILEDLIKIFHPGQIKGQGLTYYREIK